jgi:iron-sulfur cluster repair protein YtfE (RIC family)
MDLATNMTLHDRPALPPGIAYLRETHPAPTWQSHANFGELASFWLDVHTGLRDHGASLMKATDAMRAGALHDPTFQRSFIPSFNNFLQHINGHHQIEDRAYFPKFRALDPRMAAGIDLLESDHARIHAAVIGAVNSARELFSSPSEQIDGASSALDAHAGSFTQLVRLLDRHLADEEEIVIPAMLEHGERSLM